MENMGMFSDVYPACPFPKSFTYRVKNLGTGEPERTILTDSTEDIKMFDSPDKDSEDFQRSLKKTMDCIAQVCDTTVPDKTPIKSGNNFAEEAGSPLNNPPTSDTLQEEYLMRNPMSKCGPISYKKFGTPPHHPYSRNVKKDNPHYDILPSYSETKADSRPQFPVDHPEPENKSNFLDYHTKPTNQNPDPSFPRSPASTTVESRRPAPEHFIFPECTPELQQEFFMFYMQKCLKQHTEPPPYSSIDAAQPPMSSMEKRFVDSTTSPINPRIHDNDPRIHENDLRIHDNKENALPPPHNSAENPSCSFAKSEDKKPHFNFPSSASSTPPLPPQTPQLTTPIMGPSMDATLAPSPSYYPTRPDYRTYNIASSQCSNTAPPAEGHPMPVTCQPLSPCPPVAEHRYSKPPNLPPHLFPDSRTFHLQNPPLPPPRSAHLPTQPTHPSVDPTRPKSASGGEFFPDKAIPENLLATYLPPQPPKPFTPSADLLSSSSSYKFSFKDTIGKMLPKKKFVPDPGTNPSGKRTKFTAEQIRILEHFYQSVNKYVTGSNKGTLCQVTGLELSTILMWFQNKRAREKKHRANN